MVAFTVAACVPRGSSAQAAPSSCAAAFDSLQSLFRHDYPGYRDKVAGHETELAALTDSLRPTVLSSNDHQICIPALKRWAQFFRDPHVIGPWQAAPPQPHSEAPLKPAAPPADDPDRPWLRVLDDSTALVRLPSLDSLYRPVIDSMVAASSTRLHATPYLIVDVRGNPGGYTGSYDSITPLLYGGPVQFDGVDVWASPANIAHYRTLAANKFLSDTDRALINARLPIMERHVNQFVQLQPARTVRRDTIFPMPRKVVILVDSLCASSCEDFVLEARQSSKVVLMGSSHTKGVHDYGELRFVWLPGWRRVSVPTSRVPGAHLDNVGIAPAVFIPVSDTGAVEYARRYLHHMP